LLLGSKLPLATWFQAIYLVAQNKNNLSAMSLKRHLGVSYRTACRVKHKLMQATAKRGCERRLHGAVVADDAELGRVRAGKRGRGSENKTSFIAAVELSEAGYPQHVRLDPLPDLKGVTIRAWAEHALGKDVPLVTHALPKPGRRCADGGRIRRHRDQPKQIQRPESVPVGEHHHFQRHDPHLWNLPSLQVPHVLQTLPS
jgi:hypothetical protein